MKQPSLLLFTTLLFLQLIATKSDMSKEIIRIPLTYVLDWDFIAKLPVHISFSHSNVYSTSTTKQLYLMNYNLSVSVKPFPNASQSNASEVEHIQIGLKYPSEFIMALAASYGIDYSQVQFGKEEYLEVILFDDNYVESRDIFANEENYRVHVKYNFGDDSTIEDKPCQLIDGSEVYFEEYLIREALNKMTKENQINFHFNEENHTITLSGKLENLPKLTLVRGDYIFKISLRGNSINYLPAIKNIDRFTLIGYKALYEFNKFKFNENEIIFKRTSLIYQLYLFLVYFMLLTLFLVFISRRNLYDSGMFIKHILKWVFLKDRNSRIEVLKSQLE